MTPEEIETAEFFVGMRGYEPAEVRAFLHAVAAEQRQLLARVAELEAQPSALPTGDPIDLLGEHVAGIVRAAREAAEGLVHDAAAAAAAARVTAEEDARAVGVEAERRRAEADRVLLEAHAEAERVIASAAEQGRQAAEQRRAEVRAACDEMLTKLGDAVSGAQMAMLVLRQDPTDEPATDLRGDAPSENGW